MSWGSWEATDTSVKTDTRSDTQVGQGKRLQPHLTCVPTPHTCLTWVCHQSTCAQAAHLLPTAMLPACCKKVSSLSTYAPFQAAGSGEESSGHLQGLPSFSLGQRGPASPNPPFQRLLTRVWGTGDLSPVSVSPGHCLGCGQGGWVGQTGMRPQPRSAYLSGAPRSLPYRRDVSDLGLPLLSLAPSRPIAVRHP